jgi:hypothetical protein
MFRSAEARDRWESGRLREIRLHRQWRLLISASFARGGPAGRRRRHIKGHGPSRNTFDHQPTQDALRAQHSQA